MFQINKTGIEAASLHVNLSEIGLTYTGLSILQVYNTLVLLVGLLGNVLVLSGLLDHSVMTIDRTSRILLQNLAVTDIFYTLFQFLPSFTTLVARRWVFGVPFCLVDHIAANIFAVNEIHVIMVLSVYRLWFTHQRLGRASAASSRKARWFVVGLFCHDVFTNVVYHFTNIPHTDYDNQVLSCRVVRSTNHWLPVVLGLYNIVVPILTTVVANGVTICTILRIYTKKQAPSRPYKKATLIILAISITSLISYIPFFVEMFTPNKNSLPVWYPVTSMYSLSVSIVCNPFIYAIVDREFINYIKELFLILIYRTLLCVDWCWSKIYGSEGFDEDMTSDFNSFELVQMGNVRGYRYQHPGRTA
jgi:hypothetical protein